MKVLHILNELKLSGMEMMLLNSFSEWSKYNISIDILATGNDIGMANDYLKESGYQVIHIPFYQNRWIAFFNFREYLLHNKYDIIHINTEGNFLLHCLCSICTGHKKIVRTFHSIFQPRPLGRMRRLIDRFLANFFGVKYISVGDSVAQNELKNYFTNSVVIYNWYDNKRFYLRTWGQKVKSREKFGISEETFVISTIGNCSSVKRHYLVIEALAKLPLSMNWLYLHAGSEDGTSSEQKLAESLQIFDQCHFLGPVTKVEEILAISDVHVMSSKYEGLSIAAIEALACGTPTVLTRVPGLYDIINKISGIIDVDSTPHSIAVGFEYIHSMKKLQREQLQINLNNQTERIFSMKEGVRNYAIFYKDMLTR